MKLRIGPPVAGKDFYPRPILMDGLTRALQGGHVAFLGLRRTGKTSCLKAIVAHPPAEYVPLLLNLEKHHSIIDWLKDMVGATRIALDKPTHKLGWFKERGADFLKRLDKIEVQGIGSIQLSASKESAWRPAADDFLDLLKESDAPLLFLLDEFPAFLNLVVRKTSRDEVEAALNWFRSARQQLSESSARFLVTGSIGLRAVVRRLGFAPTINDFDVREIPPLKDAEALEFLEQLATDNDVRLDGKGRRHILKLLGANWPILLQLFVSEIQDKGFNKPPTLKELDRLYRERLVGGSRNKYCDSMFDRLKDMFSESEFRLAREILRTLCRAIGAFSRDDFEAFMPALSLWMPSARFLLANSITCSMPSSTTAIYSRLSATNSAPALLPISLRDYWRRKTS